MSFELEVTEEHSDAAESIQRRDNKGQFWKTRCRVHSTGTEDYIVAKVANDQPLRPGRYSVEPRCYVDRYGNLALAVGEIKPVKTKPTAIPASASG